MKKIPLIAANWKMNPPPESALEPSSPYQPREGVTVIVLPTFLDIDVCRKAGLLCGAQCARAENQGAFTGDVSMAMVTAAGCDYVLCGHSERRQHHGETSVQVGKQAEAALKAGLIPVVCIGETWEEREAKRTEEILREQLAVLPTDAHLIIAYEPRWAIGSGKTPATADIQDVHAFIRGLLPYKETSILYGGSVNPKNAEEILSRSDVDGGLIGGGSLKPDEFRAIVEAAAKIFATK